MLDISGVKLRWDIVDEASDGVVVSFCFFVAFGGVAAVCGVYFALTINFSS